LKAGYCLLHGYGSQSNALALSAFLARGQLDGSLIENWIDETERRTWFLSEIIAERLPLAKSSNADAASIDFDRRSAAGARSDTDFRDSDVTRRR
jgi:hypothetical protein